MANSVTPTRRSLAHIRAGGGVPWIVEHWNQWAKIRQDLFGIIDIVVMYDGQLVGIQATSGTHHADHKDKLLSSDNSLLWLRTGCGLELWSWSKRGARGKRKLWTLRREILTEADFPDAFKVMPDQCAVPRCPPNPPLMGPAEPLIQ